MGGVKKDYGGYPALRMTATINGELYEKFKIYCKAMNVPINTVLECFMRQYVDGEFTIDYGVNSGGIISVKAEESLNDETTVQIMPTGFSVDFDAAGIKVVQQASTTISEQVFTPFRKKIERDGVMLKTVVESFMQVFVEGGFYLKLRRDESNNERNAVKVKSGARTKANTIANSVGKTEFGEFVEE